MSTSLFRMTRKHESERSHRISSRSIASYHAALHFTTTHCIPSRRILLVSLSHCIRSQIVHMHITSSHLSIFEHPFLSLIHQPLRRLIACHLYMSIQDIAYIYRRPYPGRVYGSSASRGSVRYLIYGEDISKVNTPHESIELSCMAYHPVGTCLVPGC